MFPPIPLDDDPEVDQKDRTPPPLLMIAELGHTARDWVAIYHFFLGPLDGSFSMIVGRVDTTSEAKARAHMMDPQAEPLTRARLALLQAVPLETMH